MREFAFDVKMFAVVRVVAASRDQAEAALTASLDCADLNVTVHGRFENVKITEASVEVDDVDYPHLFEVDGHEVDNDETEAPPPGTPVIKTVD